MAGQFPWYIQAIRVETLFGESVMQRQALAAAAICCFIGGTSGSTAAGQNQMPWSDILTIVEQLVQSPVFGAPLGKVTFTRDIAQELPDGFVGTQEPEQKGPNTFVRVLKVEPLTGEQVLKAYAKDLASDSDVLNSATVVEGASSLVVSRLLFDQRRLKEWNR
jgi:hypothetical protein